MRTSGLYVTGWRFIEACLWGAVFLLPFSKSGVEIFVWTALGIWLFGKVVLRFPWLSPKSLTAFYALFLLLTFISIFQADASHALTVWRGFFKWFKYIGLFFLSYEAFQDEKRAGRIRLIFLVSVAAVVLNGFYQMYHPTDLVMGYTVDVPGRGIRMRSSFGSPNGLAGYLLLGLPVAFGAWIAQRKWSWTSVLTLVVVIGSGVALMSTLSRAAFLALFVSVGVFAVFRRKFAWIGLGASLIAVILLASPALRENFVSSLNPSDITVGERLHYWDVTLDMIRARPWIGHGVNSFFYTFPDYAPAAESYRGYAHNCYLQMAAEIGMPGLASFLAPLFWILFKVYRRQHDLWTDVLTVGAGAFLLLSSVDTHLYSLQQAVLFWVFWAMLAASVDRVKRTG